MGHAIIAYPGQFLWHRAKYFVNELAPGILYRILILYFIVLVLWFNFTIGTVVWFVVVYTLLNV